MWGRWPGRCARRATALLHRAVAALEVGGYALDWDRWLVESDGASPPLGLGRSALAGLAIRRTCVARAAVCALPCSVLRVVQRAACAAALPLRNTETGSCGRRLCACPWVRTAAFGSR